MVVADDHRVMRDGIRRVLIEAGFDIVGEAGDGQEAVRLVRELVPDLVLMDLSMPVLDGIAATRLICSQLSSVKVVILTMHPEPELIKRAKAAGAVGYLVKDLSSEEIVAAMAAMMADGVPAQPEPAASRVDPITKREAEVLQLVANGASTSQIAATLFISAKTVKNHLASIYAKLDAADRTQAVLAAARLGLIKLH